MKQILVTIALLFTCYLSVSSQKEVFFNTAKPEDIKVASMQGIEIESGFSPISIIDNLTYQKKSWGFPLSIGYFKEKRIASTWTLLYRIKLQNNLSNTPVLSYDSINHGYGFDNNSPYKATYSLGIGISIEPRWYFSYKNRYTMGRANLNSGWFLSLPVSIGVTIINTYKQPVSEYWSKQTNYGGLVFSPVLGYRQAISNHLFLEGDIVLLNGSIGFSKIDNKFIIYPSLHITAGMSIKVAYTFK